MSAHQDDAHELAKVVFYATVIGAAVYGAVVLFFVVWPNDAHAPPEPTMASEAGSKESQR